jgi:hypothetical protein
MADKPRALSQEVAALAKDFARSAAGMKMPLAKLQGWKKALEKLPAQRRDDAATELLALAARFKRMAGPATREARAQLAALAAVLLSKAPRKSNPAPTKAKKG